MKVQILIKNSKYGHDYEVVRADAFFNNKDLQEDYRERLFPFIGRALGDEYKGRIIGQFINVVQ